MTSRKRAVVIGSGGSGGIVARVLAKSGAWSVTVLEKGRNYFSGLGGPASEVTNVFANDELAYLIRTAPIMPDPILEPRTFRTEPSDGDRIFVGNVQFMPSSVGGGSLHFDAKFRRMREVDFITNSLMGGNADEPAILGTTYTDWPVQYKHMEPFYAVLEEILGVQGPAYRDGTKIVNPNPYESYRSTPFPMPPGVGMLGSMLMADSCARLGYTPAEVPTAVLSRPYRGRKACNDCAFCAIYGCATNAKSAGVWALHDALATGHVDLVAEANALRVDYRKGPNGRLMATGVEYVDANGALQHLRADLVVLANTPIEATRLSLQSGIGAIPNSASTETLVNLVPTGNEPSGLLGRNLMFHLQTVGFTFVDQDIHPWRGRCSTHTLDAFAGAGPTPAQFDPLVPRAGILEMGSNDNPISEATILPNGLLFGQVFKDFMKLGPFTKRIIILTLQGQDMPQLTNYVDLDPEVTDVYGQPAPRITYKNHLYELTAMAYYITKMEEIMENVGGLGSPYTTKTLASGCVSTGMAGSLPGQVSELLIGPLAATPVSPIPSTAHIMGTHRMAFDRDHGVTDPYGRYWAFDNLYHAGGGLFCTAPGFNVSLTIWSLAYRVAASIVTGVGGRDSYSQADINSDQATLEDVIRRLDSDTMIARFLSR